MFGPMRGSSLRRRSTASASPLGAVGWERSQLRHGTAVPEARRPQPNKPPGEDLANARRKASGVGLLAMKDAIADLRSAPTAVQLKPDIKQGPGVGTGVGSRLICSVPSGCTRERSCRAVVGMAAWVVMARFR